jgi:hypothetical protein
MRSLCYPVLYIVILLFGCKAEYGYAQAKTEKVHITYLLGSMQSQNSSVHSRLYPEFDTMFMHLEKHNPQTEVMNLRNDLTKIQKFDPAFNPDFTRDFDYVIKKGIDSGIHWREIILAGYELHKTALTRKLIGLDKIMELRFHGFIFVEDMLTRRRYCIAVKDIECMKGKWYGGHLINILEAKTIDEYEEKLALERKKMLHPELFVIVKDTSGTAVADEDEKSFLSMSEYEDDEDKDKKPRKEVAERIYYTGMFDNEIPVEMYIRGLKGNCPEISCYWEGMYKFRDHDEFIKLIIERSPEGKWIMTEDPDVGSMELELIDGKFTGVWISLKDKTEYEVHFEEKKEVRSRKLMQMDDVIENELYAQ